MLLRERHDEARGPENSRAKKNCQAKSEKRWKDARKIERSLKQEQNEAGRQKGRSKCRQDVAGCMTPLIAMILRALYWGYSCRKTRSRDTSLERRPPLST